MHRSSSIIVLLSSDCIIRYIPDVGSPLGSAKHPCGDAMQVRFPASPTGVWLLRQRQIQLNDPLMVYSPDWSFSAVSLCLRRFQNLELWISAIMAVARSSRVMFKMQKPNITRTRSASVFVYVRLTLKPADLLFVALTAKSSSKLRFTFIVMCLKDGDENERFWSRITVMNQSVAWNHVTLWLK
jgi:hypothetical protein